jgi:hypothetical protein
MLKIMNYKKLAYLHRPQGSGWLSRYSYSLLAGRSGDQIPVGARFSASVEAEPGFPISLIYSEYRVLPEGKAAGEWR